MQAIITLLSSLLLLLGIAHAELASSPANMLLSTISKAAQVASTATTSTRIRARKSLNRRLTQNQFNQCQNIAHRLVCENGLQQDLYDLALGCQQQEVANIARFSCAVNDNGLLCGQGLEISQEFAAETSSRCFSTTSCSSSCRSSISSIRDRLGCCSGYWTPLTVSRQSNFDGDLWRTCGVSTGELCPLPTFTTPNSTTRFCTQTETNRLLIAQRCMQNSSGIVVETLANTTGCGGVAKIHVETCGINSNGEFCTLNNELTAARNLIQNCAGSVNGGTCSSSCRQSMLTLRNALGCCINSIYNGTLIRIAPTIQNADRVLSFFRNSFWSRCGVTPPGKCESTLLLPESCPEVTTRMPEITRSTSESRPEVTTRLPEITRSTSESRPEVTMRLPEITRSTSESRPEVTTRLPEITRSTSENQNNGGNENSALVSVLLMLVLTAMFI